jgi:hypothetical protein
LGFGFGTLQLILVSAVESDRPKTWARDGRWANMYEKVLWKREKIKRGDGKRVSGEKKDSKKRERGREICIVRTAFRDGIRRKKYAKHVKDGLKKRVLCYSDDFHPQQRSRIDKRRELEQKVK